MPHQWLEALDDSARQEAERLIAQLESLGCPDAEHWARREVREDAPQVSRLVLLRHLWSEAIDAWRDSLIWIENLIGDARLSPDGPFAEAGYALERMIEAGADRQEIGLLARFVAFETVFSVVHTLDEGYDPEQEGQLPGWALLERDPLGHITKRMLTHLHEDLPKLETTSEK
jgi:hypothetical protein